MSETERRKGYLRRIGDVNCTDDDLDQLLSDEAFSKLQIIDGTLYLDQTNTVHADSHIEVTELDNGDLIVDAAWYNGGGSFSEVVENALKRQRG